MRGRIALFLVATALCQHARAEDGSAQEFQNIFNGTCVSYLGRLDELRMKLAPLPQLGAEAQKYFLAGREGGVWPVPSKVGVFVLAIPKDKTLCTVYARQVEVSGFREKFEALVKTAPNPMTSTQMEVQPSAPDAQTVAYEWSVPNVPRRAHFILTTRAVQDGGSPQAVASASMGPRE